MKIVKSSDRTTLLLNSAWQPIDVITAKAAFNHLLRKRVTALDKYTVSYHSLESWCQLGAFYDDQPALPSANRLWAIPTVIIVTSKFFPKRKKKKLSLHELAKVCDNTCQYCWEKFPLKELTVDHVHPKSKGGKDTHDNRVLSCGKCNRRKGSYTPWYDKYGNLPKPPKIPNIVVSPNARREEWEPFIFS